jgi:hypothetical protein
MSDHESLLLVLDELEDREARLLSWGVAEVTLSRSEVVEAIGKVDPDSSPDAVLERLLSHHLLVSVPPNLFRTRTAETVRLASGLRQWFGSGDYGHVKDGGPHPDHPGQNLPDLAELGKWQDCKRLVSDFRFQAVPRSRPARNRNRAEVLASLHPHASQAAISALEGILPETISRFQEDSLRTLLGWGAGDRDTAAIVTAGTGAGKTYAFFLPVLAQLTASQWGRDCPQVLAIYPRNVLLKDQLRVAFGLCRALDAATRKAARSPLSVGALFGDVPVTAGSVSEKPPGKGGWARRGADHLCPFFACPKCGGEMVWTAQDRSKDLQRLKCTDSKCGHRTESGEIALTRDRLRRDPPDLLFISMELLNTYLQRTDADRVIGGRRASPRFVLLDEVHTYGGVAGAQNAYVLRRWRSRVYAKERSIAWVGLSATLERPRDFFQQLVPISQHVEVVHLHPADADLEEVGKRYSLILKGNPFTQAALLAVTIQALMLLERTCALPRQVSDTGWMSSVFGHKTFAFTDTLDVFSRLEGDLTDAESKLLPWLRSTHPDEAMADCERRSQAGQRWELAEASGWSLGNPLDVRSLSSKWQDDIDRADVVVATSSLEVGFDDDEVNAVIQHKAPRDWASYLQRIGRAGRQITMRPWAVTVLSDYGRDGVAFQNYHEFFAPSLRYNPVPIENAYVIRIQAAFAVLDLLAEQTQVGGLAWKLTQGLQRTPPEEVGLQEGRERILNKIDEWIANPGSLRDRLRQRLRWPQESLLDSALYQPPRSLLYEFLPVLARLVRGEGTPAERSSAGPLAYFLPRALFQPLDLPEVEVRFDGSDGQVESMPVEQFLSEFTPLKASKRYSQKTHYSSGHWIAPKDLGKRIKEAADNSQALDGRIVLPLDLSEFGHFEPEGYAGARDGDIGIVRPIAVCLRAQGDERFTERSNAWLDWRTRLEVPGEEHLQQEMLPAHSPLSEWVSSLYFALHTHGTPVTVVRYAESARAVPQHKSNVTQFGLVEGQQISITFCQQPGGSPVALGFAQEVDGIALVVGQEALASLDSRDSVSITAGERTDYFRHWFRETWLGTVIGDSGLNSFQLDRLSGLFLGELGAQATLKGKPIADRLDRWKAKVGLLSKHLHKAADHLYGRADLEVMAVVSTEVREGLSSLLDSDVLMTSLLRCAAVLHEDAEQAEWWEEFVVWRQRRALSGLGSTFLMAVHSLLPDLDLDSLRVDLVLPGDKGSAVAKVWITESTPGGIGNVLQVRELCLAREGDFLWAWGEALKPGQAETVTSDLRLIVREFADGATELSEAATDYRRASSVKEQESSVERLQAALESKGIPDRHGLRSPLFSRVLAAGTGPGMDALTTLASAWVDETDQTFDFECPAETIQLLMAQRDDQEWLRALESDHPWRHEWARLQTQADSKVAKAWRAQRLAGLIWPRDRARAQQELGTYNRFDAGQQIDLELLRRRLPEVPSVDVGDGRAVGEWWPELVRYIQESPAEVHLKAGPTGRRDLAVAARWLATTPVDNDVVAGYLRVAAVRRDQHGWYAAVQVQDLVQ